MTLLRGLKMTFTLDVWLKNYIFPAEAKNVTEDFVRWGHRLAAAENDRRRHHTLVDMYSSKMHIAEETKAAGMRAIFRRKLARLPCRRHKTKPKPPLPPKILKRWQGDPLIHAAVAASLHLSRSAKKLFTTCKPSPKKYHAPT